MRRRIAANIAKLPESCCRSRNGEAEEDGVFTEILHSKFL